MKQQQIAISTVQALYFGFIKELTPDGIEGCLKIIERNVQYIRYLETEKQNCVAGISNLSESEEELFEEFERNPNVLAFSREQMDILKGGGDAA